MLTSLVGYRVIDGTIAHYLLGRTVSMERYVGQYVELAEVCRCSHRPDEHKSKMCKTCKDLGIRCRVYRSVIPEFLGFPLSNEWRQVQLMRQFWDQSWLAEDRLGKVARYKERDFNEVDRVDE